MLASGDTDALGEMFAAGAGGGGGGGMFDGLSDSDDDLPGGGGFSRGFSGRGAPRGGSSGRRGGRGSSRGGGSSSRGGGGSRGRRGAAPPDIPMSLLQDLLDDKVTAAAPEEESTPGRGGGQYPLRIDGIAEDGQCVGSFTRALAWAYHGGSLRWIICGKDISPGECDTRSGGGAAGTQDGGWACKPARCGLLGQS